MSESPIKRALVSVTDKTGVVEFVQALEGEFGIEVISTGGTAKVLEDAFLPGRDDIVAAATATLARSRAVSGARR